MRRPMYNYVRQVMPQKQKNKIAINTLVKTRVDRIEDTKHYLKVYEYDNIEFMFNKVIEHHNGIYGGTYTVEKEYCKIILDGFEIDVTSQEYNRVYNIVLSKYNGCNNYEQ